MPQGLSPLNSDGLSSWKGVLVLVSECCNAAGNLSTFDAGPGGLERLLAGSPYNFFFLTKCQVCPIFVDDRHSDQSLQPVIIGKWFELTQRLKQRPRGRVVQTVQ